MTGAEGLRDLARRARARVIFRAHRGGVWGGLESAFRWYERLAWQQSSAHIVEVIGDSHIRALRLLNHRSVQSSFRYWLTPVPGATMRGLFNEASSSRARRRFDDRIRRTSRGRPLVVLLGEVDAGYLVWVRAAEEGRSAAEVGEESVEVFGRFLDILRYRFDHLVVVSAPLPTIADPTMMADLRPDRAAVQATLEERLRLSLFINRLSAEMCRSRGILFVDLDEASIDRSTGRVHTSLLNRDPANHHYDECAYIRLLQPPLEAALTRSLTDPLKSRNGSRRLRGRAPA